MMREVGAMMAVVSGVGSMQVRERMAGEAFRGARPVLDTLVRESSPSGLSDRDSYLDAARSMSDEAWSYYNDVWVN
jgi:hypothetical protein